MSFSHLNTRAMLLSTIAAASAIGCSGMDGAGLGDEENLAQVEQALVVTNCSQPLPANGVAINFDRELVIRDLAVVEDSCRTRWDFTCDAAQKGKWTFGWMMANMAGTSDVTSTVAKQFVANWVKLWLSSQQPNTLKDAVAPRTAITETLIRPWLSASGCPIAATLDNCLPDLKLAPFRLLAFVNRLDLPATAGYSTGNGEFRAVFGVVGFDPISGVENAALQATVILEYNFPNTKTLQQWATLLHGLSSFVPSNTTYRTNLQTITEAIVGPNAAMNAHNRNPISHIRTNEIAFDCEMGTTCLGVPGEPPLAQWEMRQFKLNGGDFTTGRQLIQEAVSQTPQTVDDKTIPINTQLINNRTAILAGDQPFGTGVNLLGNASHSPPGIGAIVWERNVLNNMNANNMTTAERARTRHQFGFATCNGCHYAETGNQNGLFHVGPRDVGSVASISNFLSANATDPVASSNNLAPISTHSVTDPASSGQIFKYNEPWRRACEIRRILSGSTVSFTKGTGHVL